ALMGSYSNSPSDRPKPVSSPSGHRGRLAPSSFMPSSVPCASLSLPYDSPNRQRESRRTKPPKDPRYSTPTKPLDRNPPRHHKWQQDYCAFFAKQAPIHRLWLRQDR
ncbi:Hypothetical predicted protein, partial [Podarcis lilfordi]